MNVLITGGYGFIGAWITQALLNRGDSVAIYDLKEDSRRLHLIIPPDDLRKVRFICGDICDQSTLTAAITRLQISHVIHLAGVQVPTCRADPILGARVNVLGTLAVFEAVKAAKNPIERLVYASSAAVFGAPGQYDHAPLADDVMLLPSTHYGVFKCCNEANARVYYEDSGLTSIGLRPWTVYGVGRDLGMTSEPTKAIKAAVLGRPYHISFGGWTDFQYVADVAGTFINALTRSFQGAKSYNLRGTVARVSDFREALIRVIPDAERLVTVGTSQIAIAYDLSDAALERDLGPMPKTPLEEGIRQTVQIFERLKAEQRLDASDLESAQPAAVTVEV